jgi:hypothetical protein
MRQREPRPLKGLSDDELAGELDRQFAALKAGKTQAPTETLRELVALANADLRHPAWPTREVSDWTLRLWRVAESATPCTAAWMPPDDLGRRDPLPGLQQLRRLQRDLRQWFGDLEQSLGSTRRGSALGLGEDGYVRLGQARVAVRVDPSGKRVRLITLGDLRTRVLLRVQSLLAEVGPSCVRACPGCRQWIVRVGRREYCSDACRDAHYWERMPEAQRRRYREAWYERHGWTLGARSGGHPRSAMQPVTIGRVRRRRAVR